MLCANFDKVCARHSHSTHPYSQIHPQDGAHLTYAPIKNIMKALDESKFVAELDKTVTSTILVSDSYCTVRCDGDG